MIFVFTTIKINNNLKILQRFTSKKTTFFLYWHINIKKRPTISGEKRIAPGGLSFYIMILI